MGTFQEFIDTKYEHAWSSFIYTYLMLYN